MAGISEFFIPNLAETIIGIIILIVGLILAGWVTVSLRRPRIGEFIGVGTLIVSMGIIFGLSFLDDISNDPTAMAYALSVIAILFFGWLFFGDRIVKAIKKPSRGKRK